jgi:hypothetical protein
MSFLYVMLKYCLFTHQTLFVSLTLLFYIYVVEYIFNLQGRLT